MENAQLESSLYAAKTQVRHPTNFPCLSSHKLMYFVHYPANIPSLSTHSNISRPSRYKHFISAGLQNLIYFVSIPFIYKCSLFIIALQISHDVRVLTNIRSQSPHKFLKSISLLLCVLFNKFDLACVALALEVEQAVEEVL